MVQVATVTPTNSSVAAVETPETTWESFDRKEERIFEYPVANWQWKERIKDILLDEQDRAAGVTLETLHKSVHVENNTHVLTFAQTAGNSMHLESEPQKADYRPVLVNYGQVLQFWGSKCRHYNQMNTDDEARTRVSFDFRVMTQMDWNAIPQSFFDKQTTTVQAKLSLTVGSYYMRYSTKTQEFSDYTI